MNEKDKKFAVLERQVQLTSQQLEMLDKQQNELNNTKQALEKIQPGESLVPLAAGMFIKATLSDTDTIYTKVGRGVTVPKTRQQAAQLVDEQLEQLHEFQQQLTQQLVKLSELIDQVNKDV